MISVANFLRTPAAAEAANLSGNVKLADFTAGTDGRVGLAFRGDYDLRELEVLSSDLKAMQQACDVARYGKFAERAYRIAKARGWHLTIESDPPAPLGCVAWFYDARGRDTAQCSTLEQLSALARLWWSDEDLTTALTKAAEALCDLPGMGEHRKAILRAMANLHARKGPPEESEPIAAPVADEPFCLNVAPRYTPGSPALVSRLTGEQVAREEREAYERHREGLYGPEGVTKAQRLGLGRIVYERIRERAEGRGHKRHTVVTWLDIITGERYSEDMY